MCCAWHVSVTSLVLLYFCRVPKLCLTCWVALRNHSMPSKDKKQGRQALGRRSQMLGLHDKSSLDVFLLRTVSFRPLFFISDSFFRQISAE